MKRITVFAAVLILFFAATWIHASGGQYALPWSSVDSGGGKSNGGNYVVAGIPGQLDVGSPMSGGSYGIQGGFEAIRLMAPPTPTPTATPIPGPGYRVFLPVTLKN